MVVKARHNHRNSSSRTTSWTSIMTPTRTMNKTPDIARSLGQVNIHHGHWKMDIAINTDGMECNTAHSKRRRMLISKASSMNPIGTRTMTCGENRHRTDLLSRHCSGSTAMVQHSTRPASTAQQYNMRNDYPFAIRETLRLSKHHTLSRHAEQSQSADENLGFDAHTAQSKT